MNVRRRLIVGLAIGILLVVASAIVGGRIMWRAHERGWAGLTIMPPIPTRRVSTGKPPGFGKYTPQAVMLTFPRSPADHAGIGPGDKVLAIGGIDFLDTKGLSAL